MFKNHILPLMSNYRIDKIDISTCQELVNQWSKKLKGFKMVKSYAAKVLTFAIKRGYIQTNPFDAVEMPISKKKDFLKKEKEKFYTREQLLELLECFKEEGNLKQYAFFHLLAYSGMRKGEAFALTWKDINFKTREINIYKAVARGEDGLYIGPVKNDLPRIITMEAKTIELLQEWRKQQSKEILQLGGNKMTQKHFVFPTYKNNEIPEPSKTHNWLKKVLDNYNLEPLTAHGFRHTHCSLLFEAGASIKEVQYRLGHKDVQTTLDVYTHVTKQTKSSTVDKFTNYLING
ncbi:tyrosine-type recombinase/integrase [Lysinibacillus sp. NPDC093692]|uniref:tyrosine-type recombinase/integrase n=1 Tax=Lysinibacillus sp. NPDC093692 TaxID=3390578 RepID=UPI003D08F36E